MSSLLALQKINNGCYAFTQKYRVERHTDGWRWFSTDNQHGGEWRKTKRAATLDLMDFLSMSTRDLR